jgi:RNA-directed DNA polymerase
LQYRHDPYSHFYVSDPKQRHISKASVKDRLVHQMAHNILTDVFDRKFIFHSLSSRLGKGTHVGISLLNKMVKQVSANCSRPCYGLKMDVRRFFDTVDHNILKTLIRRNVQDPKILHIIDVIIDSFEIQKNSAKGIPLGNVTSQIFANIYLHELDDFVKQTLREPHYLRYCDDFIILSHDVQHLTSLIPEIQNFLGKCLSLELHPKKVIMKKITQGIDFVGYVLFPHHKLVRTRTKQRMKKRLDAAHGDFLHGKIGSVQMDQRLQSYLGILSHANQYTLSQAIKNAYWVRTK